MHTQYAQMQQLARQAMDYIRRVIRPGMALHEVRSICEQKMLELGADSFWYWDVGAFVFAGEGTAASVSGREYCTPEHTLAPDDLITIDLSPQRQKIWGDYARTFVLQGGQLAPGIAEIQNPEWQRGLLMEEFLHQELIRYAAPECTFEALHAHMNEVIIAHGFANMDFLGNLGHSIVREKADRVYIEKGNTQKLGEVQYFTFEPHIALPGSPYGYKKEDIYYFASGKLQKL